MTLAELKAQRDSIANKITNLLQVAKDDDDRSLTADELGKIEGWETELDGVENKIKNVEKEDEIRRRAEAREAARSTEQNTVQDRRTSPDQPGVVNVISNPEDRPDRGFQNHREFLRSVMDLYTGGRYDNRLKPLQVRNVAGADEQSTFADPYGGFLVPAAFSPQLLSVGTEMDPVADRVTQIPMESAVVEIPARVDKNHTSSVSGGLRVYRRAEADTSASSRMEMEQVTLRATMLFGKAYATEELLERSVISFIALLDAGFRDEFGSKLMQERLNGTGVGQMEGINNSPALVSVAKETGQAANTIVYENVIKMRARVWGYGSAIWLANHDTLPQLMLLNQAVGTGGVPLWQPSAREDHPDLLLGRPLFFTEFAETLGTAGDLHCTNWSQYLQGTLSDVQSAESVHVRFENHERTFKFWMENDGKGWWRSALTPDKSSDTLSPFVRLAVRS